MCQSNIQAFIFKQFSFQIFILQDKDLLKKQVQLYLK